MPKMFREVPKAMMEDWMVWMKRTGKALVDSGATLGPYNSVVDDGAAKASLGIGAYPVVEAPDIDAAKKLTVYHPFLKRRTGKYSIETVSWTLKNF